MAVTTRQSGTADSNNPQVTLGATPVQGNLLVAVLFMRTGPTAISTTMPSGWTERLRNTFDLSNTSFRRQLVVASKVAGASESATHQFTAPNSTKLLLLELQGAPAWEFLAAASNNNGATSSALSLATGTTSSVAAGDKVIIGVGGWRGASSDDIVAAGFTSIDLSGNIFSASGNNGRGMTFSFVEDTTSGTKASTLGLTSNFSGTGNTGVSAGILVFDISTSGGVLHEVNIDDSLALSDAITPSMLLGVAISDSMGLADSIVGAQDHRIFVNEAALALADAVTTALNINLSIADSVALVDDIIVVLERLINIQIDDILGVDDAVALQMELAQAIADSLGLSDAVIAALAHNIEVDDSVALEDAVLVELIQAISVVISDELPISDAILVAQGHNLTIGDVLVLADEITLAQEHSVSINDVLGLSDTISVVIPSGAAAVAAVRKFHLTRPGYY